MRAALFAAIFSESTLVSLAAVKHATYDRSDLNVSIAKYRTGFPIKLRGSAIDSVAATNGRGTVDESVG